MINRSQLTSRRMVRWIFQRGNELLSCGVEQEADRSSYTLSLVPDSCEDPVIVERFESSILALQHHAAIAAQLRELGWTLVAYTRNCSASRRSRQLVAA